MININSPGQENIVKINPKGERVESNYKQRKGFILGLGIGAGASFISSEINETVYDDVVTLLPFRIGMTTDFKIGYAPSNSFLLYLTVKNNYCTESNIFDDSGGGDIFQCRLGGVAVSYYFKPESPSLFLTLAIGSGILNKPFFVDVDYNIGICSGFGVGYEFKKRWSCEMNCLLGTAKCQENTSDQNINYYSNLFNLLFTLSYTFY